MRTTSELVDMLDRGQVDLVVDLTKSEHQHRNIIFTGGEAKKTHVEALDILAIAFDNIDEVVDVGVLAKQDLAIVDLVLVQDIVHNLLGVRAELDKIRTQ